MFISRHKRTFKMPVATYVFGRTDSHAAFQRGEHMANRLQMMPNKISEAKSPTELSAGLFLDCQAGA
jgi:hypothetical protein